MGIYVEISFISVFLFLWFKNYFIRCVDFTHIAASNTTSDMTSQIRSHIEYLIQTYYILLLILQSKFMKNVALMTVLIRFNDDTSQWLTFLGPSCRLRVNLRLGERFRDGLQFGQFLVLILTVPRVLLSWQLSHRTIGGPWTRLIFGPSTPLSAV